MTASNSGSTDAVARSWRAVERALARADEVDLGWLGPLPPPRAWPLDGPSLRFLASLVAELRPGFVLEFGSGLSTQVIARACGEGVPPGRLLAVENDPQFAEHIRHVLNAEVSAGLVAVALAPLVVRYFDRVPLPVFHLEQDSVAPPEPVSLALIDAPPELLGGRSGTLFQAMEFAQQGTVILVDDADRSAEADILAMWKEAFGEVIEIRPLPGLPNFAVIVVTSATPSSRGWWWLERPPAWSPKPARDRVPGDTE